MFIKEINTENKKDVQKFLKLPFRLYENCSQWVPPLEMDARHVLDKKKNPFYKKSDAAFLMIFNDAGSALGRIAVIDNIPYNTYNKSKTAFFYYFECVEEFSAAKALFEEAFVWAKKRGLETVFGPKGFTALNGLGMLTRGFEHRPAFGIPYNHLYYPVFLEGMGFKKEREVLSGYLHRSHQIPEKVSLISKKVQKRWGVRVEQFNTRKDLRKILPYIKGLYNGTLIGTSGNAPLTDEDVNAMADQILWFADPTIIKILMKGDKAVGFLLAYPDISAALQKTKGRLWPFGWIQMLHELRHTNWVNINGAGIIGDYRGLGGTAVLFDEMAKSIKSGRYEHADLVQIGVENERMQLELSSIGIDFYKSHCLYSRSI